MYILATNQRTYWPLIFYPIFQEHKLFHKIKNINCVIVSVILAKWSYIATDINKIMKSTREIPLHVKAPATIAVGASPIK
jgi:hypothetical protein